MKKNGKTSVYYLVFAAIIAAIYVVLTLVVAPFAWGPIQFRISEMLCVLPLFTEAAIPGVTLGCLIANILIGSPLPDIVFGTLATFIGVVFTFILTRKYRENGRETEIKARILAIIPPILSNSIIIPLVLKFAYGLPDAVLFMAVTVGIGEILAVGVLGNILITVLKRSVVAVFRSAISHS
ncbi:MAG: QueT transporter family protein [Eubacteriales bacterium]|nr:QueT transporter family protein [Eubacteriales bacterium]